MSLPQRSTSSSLQEKMKSPPRVEIVSETVSRQLLKKFSDVLEAGFDNYEQSGSGLWSPLIRRNMFLSSSVRICSENGLMERFQNMIDARSRRKHSTYCLRTSCCM